MSYKTRINNLTDAELRAFIDDAERQALGGVAGAITRAGLGTLALVLAISAITDPKTVGLILLSGAFILGLAVFIWSVARSASMTPRVNPRLSRTRKARLNAPVETVPATPFVGTAAGS